MFYRKQFLPINQKYNFPVSGMFYKSYPLEKKTLAMWISHCRWIGLIKILVFFFKSLFRKYLWLAQGISENFGEISKPLHNIDRVSWFSGFYWGGFSVLRCDQLFFFYNVLNKTIFLGNFTFSLSFDFRFAWFQCSVYFGRFIWYFTLIMLCLFLF